MDNQNGMPYRTYLIVSIIVIIVVVIGTGVVVSQLAGTPKEKMQLAMAYAMLLLFLIFGFLVVTAIATNKIDISSLLAEGTGDTSKASMSRFQLLIFTFVIGMSFFLVVLCECKIPEIPNQVLTLLGISASTYGVSKGIHASTTDQSGGSDSGGGAGGQADAQGGPQTGGKKG
jgi:uncharacterized membrane protein YgcG